MIHHLYSLCGTLLSVLLLILPASVARGTELPYAMHPALHGDRLIFAAEGDLWICTIPPAPAEGDPEPVVIAYRLTSGDGIESHPVISPDGTRVAFAAEYEGNTDVYVMPVDGGRPTRLTWHPAADHPVAWRPDGRMLYLRSARHHPQGRTELFEMAPRTGAGLPQPLRIGTVDEAAFSGTGNRIAFTRFPVGRFHWRGYRGGTTPSIWIGDLAGQMFTQLTEDRVTSDAPMWVGGRIFYRSDRDGQFEIWSERPQGGDRRKHVSVHPTPDPPGRVDAYDVRFPAVDAQPRGNRIVFVQGGVLSLLEPESDRVRRLNVRIASDRVAARPRFVPVHEGLTGIGFDRDAGRFLIESRGEIAIYDRSTGVLRQVTRTPSVRESGITPIRDDLALMITDRSGEQQLVVLNLESGGMMTVTEDRREYLFAPQVAPNGAHAAFADKSMRLHLIDLSTLNVREITASSADEITDYRFSPDGQWLAWAHPEANGMQRIRLVAVRTGRIFDVTDGRSFDALPRWDPAGRYLYFVSVRRPDPIFDWSDFTYTGAGSMQVFCVPLEQHIPPPIAAITSASNMDLHAWARGEETWRSREHDEDLEDHDDHELVPAAMSVDPVDLTNRIIALPIAPGLFDSMEAVAGGVLVLRRPLTGLHSHDSFADGAPLGRLERWFAPNGDEASVVTEDVGEFSLSPNHDEILTFTDGAVVLTSLNAPDDPEMVSLNNAILRVDPMEEWRQVLRESWRLLRDFFWAPNLLGLDWNSIGAHMEALLPRIGTRAELEDLIAQLARELRTSHAYAWGGDRHARERPDGVPDGLLGAKLESVGGRIVIRNILRGDDTDHTLTGPLSHPHLDVRPGDVITAIDDTPLRAGDNPYMLLEGAAHRPVRLAISREGTSRTIQITPIADESSLRYLDWVERNRQAVEDASAGRIGYIHLPDMDAEGLSRFMRMFPPVHDRPALLIDIRGNGGGFVSQLILKRLAARPLAFMSPRHGRTFRYPDMAPNAHMAFLIDEFAGSDGDIFPAMARRLKLGPLIGTRTWGGVVGIRLDKFLQDAGALTQPEYAWWEAEGGWTIENEGVPPDVDVRLTPADARRDRDPQLEAGIAHLLSELERDAKPMPVRPDYPVR